MPLIGHGKIKGETMSFLLAEEGQTAKIKIDDLEFEIKVLTYRKRMEWAEQNDKTTTWDEMKESICNVVVNVEGFESPSDFLDKIVKATDINKIIIALASAAGLDEDIGKNLEGLSEPQNLANTKDVEKIVEPASDNVSTTPTPSFSGEPDSKKLN